MTGAAAVPTTRIPVTIRPVTEGFGVPSSSWLGMVVIIEIVSVAATA